MTKKHSAITLSVLAVLLMAGVHCSSSEEKLSVGEKADLMVDDAKIGVIEQVTETERHLLIDRDQDGVVEKRIILEDGKVTRIAYPQTETGMAKEVLYQEGVPVKVNVSDAETLKGIAMLENENVTHVELPAEKKKIIFSEGAISEILDLE